MAANSQLVLAFFESEAKADEAADALRAWAKVNKRAQLDSVGVLVKDDKGDVKTHKLGPREGKKGIGVGIVLGVVAAVVSGGVTLAEGVVVGTAGGGVVGSLFHRGLDISAENAEHIASRLDAGHAAVGVLVSVRQAPAVTAELETLGGEPEVHQVSPDAVAAPTATATVAPPA
jgi:uncharacterized membrane protein